VGEGFVRGDLVAKLVGTVLVSPSRLPIYT